MSLYSYTFPGAGVGAGVGAGAGVGVGTGAGSCPHALVNIIILTTLTATNSKISFLNFVNYDLL